MTNSQVKIPPKDLSDTPVSTFAVTGRCYGTGVTRSVTRRCDKLPTVPRHNQAKSTQEDPSDKDIQATTQADLPPADILRKIHRDSCLTKPRGKAQQAPLANQEQGGQEIIENKALERRDRNT